jgi:hypothetical protein
LRVEADEVLLGVAGHLRGGGGGGLLVQQSRQGLAHAQRPLCAAAEMEGEALPAWGCA